MIKLYSWQKELLDRLLSKDRVVMCHFYDYDKTTTAFLFVVEKMLDECPDMDCDFMAKMSSATPKS